MDERMTLGVLDLRPRDACEAIQSYWLELDELHSGRHQLVRYLQEFLTERRDEMYDVQTRDVAEQKVLSTRRHLTVRHLPSYLDESYRRLTEHLAASGATGDGPGFVIFHGVVDETSDGPVEVALPYSGTVEPHEDLGVRLEPARTEAFTTITKAQVSFPEILRAYDAVEAWLTGQGLSMALSPREVYFAEDWAAAADDDPVCDVAFPYTLRSGSVGAESAGSARAVGQ